MKQKKKIAVVLAGCGNKDGSEIHESVALIMNLKKAGIDLQFFAPNANFTATNFLTGAAESAPRNLMSESARITRSQMSDLQTLNPDDFDALALPGGFGAALHLSNWASRGAHSEVLPHLATVIREFHAQSKPIAAICIAPVLLARVLGKKGITITTGVDDQTAAEIRKTGAMFESCPVNDYVTDREHKIITTPAYMYDDAQIHEVFQGIGGLCKELIEMA